MDDKREKPTAVPRQTVPGQSDVPVATFEYPPSNHKLTLLMTTSELIVADNGTQFSQDRRRHCTSLPLYYDQSELCTLGSRPGMECMPLRSPPGPYHYHVTDQTKSLQELQNEVGALLEFRDLVIETFPDLKQKMASMSTSNTITGVQTSSLASRREWEPGIRVRRKLTHKDNVDNSSSLIRSRSNSHSGKNNQPKSGEGNGSVVQDSGFSTETSSSKETHSASSTTGPIVVHPTNNHTNGNHINTSINQSHRLSTETDDELWNLLDVIHRKSSRLRDEVELLQNIEQGQDRGIHKNTQNMSHIFRDHLDRMSREDVQILRKERDRLLDKLSEMEAETIAGRIRSSKMNDEVEALCLVKRDLEEQLRAALSQKIELNSKIHDMHQQFVNKSTPSSPESSKSRQLLPSPTTRKMSTDFFTPSSPTMTNPLINRLTSNATTFTPVILKSSDHNGHHLVNSFSNKLYDDAYVDSKQLKNEMNLGRLDGLVSSPNRCNKVRVADSKKIAAILLENNIIELQRHLLTLTVQNQVLTQRLEQATKSKIFLTRKLDKAKEDLDDLKFQLEERNIELEGTKAQVRILETKITNKSDFSPDHHSHHHIHPTISSSQVSTPSMKAMIPLAMDEIQHNSSSTESAQDQTERDRLCPETPKRRPSKIPLPGTKGYLAPKPPTGRLATSTANLQQRSPSGPPSNRSLSKSTSSLIGRSGPSSVRKDREYGGSKDTPSLNRPDSAQSIRKDSSSLTGRSSSIPVAATTKTVSTRQLAIHSPIPKPRRESLTSKVRSNMDSLSRIQLSSPPPPPSPSSPLHGSAAFTSSTPNLYKTNSKKDLNASFSAGQSRDPMIRKPVVTSAAAIRRVSSASTTRNSDVSSSGGVTQVTQTTASDTTDNGKIENRIESKIENRDLIREYLARTRGPPPIFKPSTNYISPYGSPTPQFDELAYKHPRLLSIMNTSGNSSVQTSSIYSLSEKNREVDVTVIKDNSIELLDEKRNKTEPCKLIGKVNPNLIKTWERLNGTIDRSGNQLFYPPANFERPIQNRSGNSNISSGNFYDSIDDGQLILMDDGTSLSSICYEETAAGEELAHGFASVLLVNDNQ